MRSHIWRTWFPCKYWNFEPNFCRYQIDWNMLCYSYSRITYYNSSVRSIITIYIQWIIYRCIQIRLRRIDPLSEGNDMSCPQKENWLPRKILAIHYSSNKSIYFQKCFSTVTITWSLSTVFIIHNLRVHHRQKFCLFLKINRV